MDSGIGFEASLLFAQEGASVLLVDINIAAAERAAALVNERFPDIKALACKADVGKEVDVKAAVDLAVKEFGRLDIMVWSIFDPVLTGFSESQDPVQFNNAGTVIGAFLHLIVSKS